MPRKRKIPKLFFPAGITRDYYVDIISLVDKMHQEFLKFYEAKVRPHLSDSVDHTVEPPWDVKNDAGNGLGGSGKVITPSAIILDKNGQKTIYVVFDDILDEIMAGLDGTLERATLAYFSERITKEIVTKFVNRVKNYTITKVGKQIKAVIGFDPLKRDLNLEAVAKACVKENVSLIKSIPVEYHQKIESVVLQGYRSGLSHEKIIKQIREIKNVTYKRAKLIAVDQGGSLMGDITKARHESAGLKRFKWLDSGDDRVRKLHREFNGKTYTWKDGADGHFPGKDIRCRCTAEVVEEDLLSIYVPVGEKKAS